MYGFHEADLAAERAGRDRAVRAEERAPRRVEHVVAGVARDGAAEAGEADLREDAVDARLIFRVELLVERPGRAERRSARSS